MPKIQENKILYTRISAKKYRIPWLKTPKIPYTQNPWPGLTMRRAETTWDCLIISSIISINVIICYQYRINSLNYTAWITLTDLYCPDYAVK